VFKGKSRIDGELYRRAMESIAHGSLTNSKRPESYVKNVFPVHLKEGNGCYVHDTFGNRYVDFICGLGSNLFGYGNEEIAKVVSSQFSKGAVLSLGTPIEVEAAERVKAVVPVIERLRFLKTGSEATAAALIIARAFTKREKVLSDGYHSWMAEFTSLTAPANGVVRSDYRSISKFNSLDDINDKIAAVILEPVIIDNSPVNTDFLQRLRQKCTKHGALLIFDEIITGFRVPEYTIAQRLGITPDLICLGKAIGGGLPLSVVGGKKDIMESEYFVSSTFAGDTLALAACIKVLDLLKDKYKLEDLWLSGEDFRYHFNQLGEGIVSLEGYPTRGIIQGEPLNKALFMQEACKAGLLFGSSLFYNFCHVGIKEDVLSILRDVFGKLKRGECELEGEMPSSPFAQKVREKT
jgi:glutamate-1-semialdehyde 2,1-aminomutase